MKGEDKVASPAPGASWTRADAYIGAMARKRSFRRAREDKPRTQPVAPHAWLSTIPFAALLVVLAIMAAATILVAFPGQHSPQKPREAQVREQGVAQRGWFQDAQKQFHK